MNKYLDKRRTVKNRLYEKSYDLSNVKWKVRYSHCFGDVKRKELGWTLPGEGVPLLFTHGSTWVDHFADGGRDLASCTLRGVCAIQEK